MRYAFLSDIHSNFYALEAVLREIEEEKVDRILCLGDILGYGTEPRACLQALIQRKVSSVAGLHDRAAFESKCHQYFGPFAHPFLEWNERSLTSEDLTYLRRLPLVDQVDEMGMVHGSFFEPHRFHSVFETFQSKENFDFQTESIAFCGHTHRTVVFVKQGGQIARQEVFEGEIQLPREGKVLINAGSVGHPRDYDPRAAYVIYDSKEKKVWFRRVEYPVEDAVAAIEKAGLPRLVAERLRYGR